MQHLSLGKFWFSREGADHIAAARQQSRKQASQLTNTLTQREYQLLAQICHGQSNQEIADKLCVSTHTVKGHLTNLYKKLEVKSRNKAVTWGLVVNQTVTFAGQSFAKNFTEIRIHQHTKSQDNIYITEKTSALWDSVISIIYKNNTLISMSLQNGRPVDAQRIGQFVAVVEKKIQMYKLEQVLAKSIDLAKGEI